MLCGIGQHRILLLVDFPGIADQNYPAPDGILRKSIYKNERLRGEQEKKAWYIF